MPVSWGNWFPIKKSSYNYGSIKMDKPNNLATAEEKNEPKQENRFGEAATLTLTGDFVRQKSSSEIAMLAATKAAARTLKVGSKGDDVKQLQKNLNTLGYGLGTPDGIFGNGTKTAVTKFQTLYGISADGIAGSGTQDAITKTINRQNSGILARGQISNDVKKLQNDLKTLGYLSGTADGQFGAGTESAVKAFQKAYGLTQDGLAGSGTRSKIAAVIAEKNKPKPVDPTPTPSNPGTVKKITNGATLSIPGPGSKITVSLGTDKPSISAKVKTENAWSIEYSINGCKNAYGENALCTKRLQSAISKFSYNKDQYDLLKLDVPEFGTCYAGAMVEGFGSIGDIAEITLDDGTKFNFMLLDAKSTKHKSSELSPNNQCQNAYGHGYMSNNNTEVQLSICEFITSKSSEKQSAKYYPSGEFLKGRYVTSAKIVGHANIE